MVRKVNLNTAKKPTTTDNGTSGTSSLGGSPFGASPFGSSSKPAASSLSIAQPSPPTASSSKPIKPPKELIVRPFSPKASNDTLKIHANVETLRAYGINSGDLIVTSKPDQAGIVGIAESLPATATKEIVKLSKASRSLLGLVLGDRIEIKKYTPQPEHALHVKIGTSAPDPEKSLSKVSEYLHSVGVIMPGLSFSLPFEDSQEYTFVIVDCGALPDLSTLSLEQENNVHDDENDTDLLTPAYLFDPKKNVKIEFTTNLVSEKVHLPVSSGFAGIGGLTKQIGLLKSKIKLPLHYPHLYKRFNNSTPERGFLLHGPPGTGKTMLLRAIAHEMDTHVLTINGPSIVSKYLGETEETLRKIFAEARKYQPAIIFIDEVDALVPKRGGDDAGEAESRVVSTLLTLMDGMSGKGSSDNRVIVIGATNRPNSIDPALRRAGRFGQEIEIGIPDAEERLSILNLHMQGMPHQLDESFIQELAAKHMHGYVGADIFALVSHCVSLAVDRGFENDLSPSDMYITTEDINRALLDIRPSAMREIFLETPKVYWTDIGGQETVKQKLKETIDWPLSHPDTFKRLGVQPPKGILLYGPPGCSKTLTAKALATEAGLNFLAVKGPEIFNKYVGESERAIREIFRKARAAAPSIIFFDEIDSLSGSRDGGESSSSDRVLTSLLNEMDGIETLFGVTILAATNRPDVIDAALMRPGRLDRLIYVGPPDYEARIKILELQFKKMAVAEDVNVEELATRTDGCSGAEIVQFTQEAGLLAMNESLEIESVHKRHLETALQGIKRGITKSMLEYYENYEKEGRID